jgi:hypothetical protein
MGRPFLNYIVIYVCMATNWYKPYFTLASFGLVVSYRHFFFKLGLKTRDYGATNCVIVLQSCIRTRVFFIYNLLIETQFFLLEPLWYGINVCPYVHFCSVCVISERVAFSYL